MVHISFWFMLLMLIYWEKVYTETSVFASKENELEVYADKTKHMIMSRDQNAGRSYNMKIDTSSFERVE